MFLILKIFLDRFENVIISLELYQIIKLIVIFPIDGHGMFFLEQTGERSDSSSTDSKGTVKGDESNSEDSAFHSHVNVSILKIPYSIVLSKF